MQKVFECLEFAQRGRMVKDKESRGQHLVGLRIMVLGILKCKRKKALLQEDLRKMGCHGLMKQLSCFGTRRW